MDVKEIWNLTQDREFNAAGANGTDVTLRDFMQRLADIANGSSVGRRTRAKKPIYTSNFDVGTQELAELQIGDLVAQGFTSEAAKLQQQYDESCDDDTDPFVPLTALVTAHGAADDRYNNNLTTQFTTKRRNVKLRGRFKDGFVVPQSLSEERDQSLEDSKKLEEEDEEDLPPMKRRRPLKPSKKIMSLEEDEEDLPPMKRRRPLKPSKKIMSLEKDEEDLPPIRIGLPPKRQWQERYRLKARGPD